MNIHTRRPLYILLSILHLLSLLLLLPIHVAFAQGKATSDLAPLIRDLKDQTRDVRIKAAYALSELGMEAKEAIPALVELFYDKDDSVRAQAGVALGNIGLPAVPALIGALKGQDQNARRWAAYSLAQMGNDGRGALPALIEAYKSDNEAVRINAAQALIKIGEASVEYLVVLLDDQDVDIRRKTVYTIAKLAQKAEAAIPHLIKSLEDSDQAVKVGAASALAAIGPKAIPSLIKALKNQKEDVRLRAAYALSDMGQKAKKVNSPESAQALAEMTKAVPALTECLVDQMPVVRKNASKALGFAGTVAKTAIPALITLLSDQEQDIRLSAATTIRQISDELRLAKDTGSVDLLSDAYVSLKNSQDPEVRPIADIVKGNLDYLELLRSKQFTKWIADHPILAAIIAIYLMLSLACLVFLWLRPFWLLRINEAISDSTDIKLPDWLGGIKLSLRYILLVGFFRYHPRLLDAWVAKHINSAQKAFSAKRIVEERQTYIPIPLALNGEVVSSIKADDLRPIFSKNLTCLLVWGEGGAGKTSLTCLLAKWAMSEEIETRLCKDHLMLPVLIDHELDPSTNNGEIAFLRIINNQLKAMIDAVDPVPQGLLRHLLKRRRVLVIVDGLSEMNEASRASILDGIIDLSVNAVIITSRADEPLNDMLRNTIKPLRIEGDKISTFIEAYLRSKRKRELFNDEAFFEACRKLSRMVGNRKITPMLAKLYVEQLIATDEDLPNNVPDLMLEYVSRIYDKAIPNVPDLHDVLHAAKIIAWECMRKSYRPMSAGREDIVAALGGEKEGFPLLQYFEETLKIIQTGGVARDQIRFADDPLAGYLASMHLLDEFDGDEQAWRKFLTDADEKDGGSNLNGELFLALHDCFLARGADVRVPNFVVSEVAKRAGLAPESQMAAAALGGPISPE